MNLWDFLDARAERRAAQRVYLVESGLDWRSLLKALVAGIDPRFLIAATIIGLFAWAFARTTDRDTANLMVGALIAAFAGAWGYYLGSSNSANQANDRADSAMKLGHEALRQLPAPQPTTELAPGERVTIGAEDPTGEGDPQRRA